MNSMIAFSVVFVCMAVLANGSQVKQDQKPTVNTQLEDKFVAKYGSGKPVSWQEVSKMSEDQLKEVCKSVHEKTGFGKIENKDLKSVSIQNAYLKFSNTKYRLTPTQILSCEKNNQERYVYYLAKALDKDSAMLVYQVKNLKSRSRVLTIKGKNVFTFTRRDQITNIPALQSA